jgi:type IX secretion system PorP/SprF family membrane protein
MKNRLSLIFILFAFGVQAQEDYFVSHTRFFQKVNPSYFGFNNLNKVGVLYNTLKINSGQSIDNKYFFGALSFDEKKFSLGMDFNSFQIDSPGITQNNSSFSYVYKVQLNNSLFFLPAITLGIGNLKYNSQGLIFEDQLDQATGFINTETNDPSGFNIKDVNYFDLGASFILHNEDFLIGLSLKNLNQPNVSLTPEFQEVKKIKYALSGAYEFNINEYERSVIPRHSYLLTYGSITSFNNTLFFYFSEEVQLGEFSLGISQQLSNVDTFNLNNIGMSVGLSLENFDFGIFYNFPIRQVSKVFSPSIFEINLTFDFSQYRRNNRGLYKRLQTDNYF